LSKNIFLNTTLAHFTVISKIGAGGMAEVYLAHDTKLDRKVAIKFLHEEFSKDADMAVQRSSVTLQLHRKSTTCVPSRDSGLCSNA